MKYTYTGIKEKVFDDGIKKVNQLAIDGWRLVEVVSRGRTYCFVLEKEVK
jgi:hypothetical protein